MRVHRFGRLALAAFTVLALAPLTGCGPVLGKPALRQQAVAPSVFDDADPAVLVVGSRTYLFGTTNNMRLPVREITSFAGSLAASQQAWASNPRDAMPARPAWVSTARPSIWAPSVVRIGTSYVVYFAAHRSGATDLQNDQCIGRGLASSPTGPFAPEANPIYCGLPTEPGANRWGRGALDPSVVATPAGHRYLLVALSRTTGNIGVVPLDASGKVVGGTNATPRILARQQFPWHDGVDDGTMTSAAFLENPSMVYEPSSKTYLLFYSAGSWNTANYVTGFGRCESPVGPCALQSAGPFLKGSATRSGVGGLAAFTAADGTLRAAYHSWTRGHESPTTNPLGVYSRQVSWAKILVAGSDPGTQSVTLG